MEYRIRYRKEISRCIDYLNIYPFTIFFIGTWITICILRIAPTLNETVKLKHTYVDSCRIWIVSQFFIFDTIWLVVSTHLKNMSQIGNLPQFSGWKWNHHPAILESTNIYYPCFKVDLQLLRRSKNPIRGQFGTSAPRGLQQISCAHGSKSIGVSRGSCMPTSYFRIHPGRLAWNLQINHLERKMTFQTSMIMFHFNLPGCKFNQKFQKSNCQLPPSTPRTPKNTTKHIINY